MESPSLTQLYAMYSKAQIDNMNDLMASIAKEIKQRQKELAKSPF